MNYVLYIVLKKTILKPEEASDDNDKYTYYNSVIEEDSYYKEAKEFVSNYLKDEISELESEVKRF